MFSISAQELLSQARFCCGSCCVIGPASEARCVDGHAYCASCAARRAAELEREKKPEQASLLEEAAP